MTDHNHHNPRQLAEDALRLAEKATKGPWKEYKFAIHPVLDYGASANDDHIICDDFCGPDAVFNRRFVLASRQLVPDLATALLAALDRVGVAERYAAAKQALDDETIRLSMDKDKLRDKLYKEGVDVYQIQSRVNWEIQFNPEIEQTYKQAKAEFEKIFGVKVI